MSEKDGSSKTNVVKGSKAKLLEFVRRNDSVHTKIQMIQCQQIGPEPESLLCESSVKAQR